MTCFNKNHSYLYLSKYAISLTNISGWFYRDEISQSTLSRLWLKIAGKYEYLVVLTNFPLNMVNVVNEDHLIGSRVDLGRI